MGKIYCDMDGVLCNFDKKFREISNGTKIIDFANFYGWDKTWNLIEDNGVEYWSELEWMNDGKILWDYLVSLKSQTLEILTGSPYGLVGKYAIEGKELWCEKHLNVNKLIINHIPGKYKYKYIQDNDILIDDSKRNCELWYHHGGISILHTNTKDTIKTLNLILENKKG